ncbi:MAG: COX15/CtaA family protein [Chitinophagaceae bacterium]
MEQLVSNEAARRQKLVARWLYLGVGMLVVQIALGGITRLTGSGLSITEWMPILGVFPPLNEHAWQLAFEKYQGIAQFRVLNAHFTLSDFKAIYFWEWAHRDWARLVGLVFLVGFIYFLVRKYFTKGMVIPLVILFLLGVAQGVIGWIMVRSGLNETNLYVSHIRLAVHFISALVLLCYTLWFALLLSVPESNRVFNKRLQKQTIAIIAILAIQLMYGAFMAGLRAAPFAPTWPGINGSLLPGQINHYGNQTYHGIDQIFSNPLAVQFIHRSLAFIIFWLIFSWTFFTGKLAKRQAAETLKVWHWWPGIFVLLQVILGILAVTHSIQIVVGKFGVYEILAESHQLVAMLLLVSLICNLYLLRGRQIAG